MTDQSLLQACTQAAKLLQEAIAGNMSPNTSENVDWASVDADCKAALDRELTPLAKLYAKIPPDKILVDRAQYDRDRAFIAKTINLIPYKPDYTPAKGVTFHHEMWDVIRKYSQGETP